MNKIKITSKGQITIPQELREKLEIRVGTYLSGYIVDGSLVLKPLPDDRDNAKFLKYAYRESQDSIGVLKVREMAKGFNVNMQKQVRELREEESGAE